MKRETYDKIVALVNAAEEEDRAANAAADSWQAGWRDHSINTHYGSISMALALLVDPKSAEEMAKDLESELALARVPVIKTTLEGEQIEERN